MDARPGKGLKTVQPSHFTADQRRRLEAVTAARGLLVSDDYAHRNNVPPVDEMLQLARYIETGAVLA